MAPTKKHNSRHGFWSQRNRDLQRRGLQQTKNCSQQQRYLIHTPGDTRTGHSRLEKVWPGATGTAAAAPQMTRQKQTRHVRSHTCFYAQFVLWCVHSEASANDAHVLDQPLPCGETQWRVGGEPDKGVHKEAEVWQASYMATLTLPSRIPGMHLRVLVEQGAAAPSRWANRHTDRQVGDKPRKDEAPSKKNFFCVWAGRKALKKKKLLRLTFSIGPDSSLASMNTRGECLPCMVHQASRGASLDAVP